MFLHGGNQTNEEILVSSEMYLLTLAHDDIIYTVYFLILVSNHNYNLINPFAVV